MAIYLDNDAACKMAGYGMFDDFLQVYGIAPVNVFRRSAMMDVFDLRGREISPLLKDQTHKTALFELMKITRSPPVNRDALKMNDELLGYPGIDVGEAQLVAYAAVDKGSMFATGDKTALMALSSTAPLVAVAKALAGRCLHLEQIIEAIAKAKGMADVRARILAVEPGIDTRLYDCMREGSDAGAALSLKKSITQLRLFTGNLLV